MSNYIKDGLKNTGKNNNIHQIHQQSVLHFKIRLFCFHYMKRNGNHLEKEIKRDLRALIKYEVKGITIMTPFKSRVFFLNNFSIYQSLSLQKMLAGAYLSLCHMY